ncbi:MAG: hypothetical protein ACJ71Z_13250 [Aeromicrobium sp.]
MQPSRSLAVVALMLAVTACGIGRPSVEEISAKLREPDKSGEQISPKGADCIAKAIYDNDEIPNSALRDYVNGKDEAMKSVKDMDARNKEFDAAIGKCMQIVIRDAFHDSFGGGTGISGR